MVLSSVCLSGILRMVCSSINPKYFVPLSTGRLLVLKVRSHAIAVAMVSVSFRGGIWCFMKSFNVILVERI